jgi:hypothetical protein
MALTQTDKETLNNLYKEFGLSPDQVFVHPHYKIITRSGVDLIQSSANIRIRYEPVASLCDITSGVVAIKAYGTRYDTKGEIVAEIETFGEASPANNKNAYPVAMAEKRAMSRAVLKLAGLYKNGFFSEDESDDFSAFVRKQRG